MQMEGVMKETDGNHRAVLQITGQSTRLVARGLVGTSIH